MNGKRGPSPKLRRRLQQVLGVSNFDDLFIIKSVDDQPTAGLHLPHGDR